MSLLNPLKQHLFLVISLFLIPTYNSEGQKVHVNNNYLNFTYHPGKFIKIHDRSPENSSTSLLEMNVRLNSLLNKPWSSLHHYPTPGISFSYATFGNDSILGNAWCITPSIRFQWIQGEHNHFYLQSGLGIARFNKYYDRETNPDNLVIGSRFTAQAHLQIGYALFLKERYLIGLGASLFHFSNAHLSVPNIGANVLGIHVSLIRNLTPLLHVSNADELSKTTCENWRPFVRLRMGLHEFRGTVEPRDGPLYQVWGVSSGFQTTSGNKTLWSLGMNLSFHQAHYSYAVSQQLFPNADGLVWKSTSMSAFGGREWYFGRLHFFLELTLFVHRPFEKEFNRIWNISHGGWLNQHAGVRLGYRYFFVPKDKSWHEIQKVPNVGIAVKTNGGTANFFEFSLGYSF